MDSQHFSNSLSNHHPLPIAMGSYLSVSLMEFYFAKDSVLDHNGMNDLYLPCIKHGMAMLSATNNEDEVSLVLDFYAEGDFLPSIQLKDLLINHRLQIIFLEETTIQAINQRHYSFLPKVFPTTSMIYAKLNFNDVVSQCNRRIILNIKPMDNRLAAFYKWRPNLKGRISENLIAKYLELQQPNDTAKT